MGSLSRLPWWRRPGRGERRSALEALAAVNLADLAATPFGELSLWWISAYGGGLFLPVRDGTCGHGTYGGGRYLTDTVKGTHGRGLEVLSSDRVRLDFNYLYNPSCAYDDAWLCPLAPPENRVPARIEAGELSYH